MYALALRSAYMVMRSSQNAVAKATFQIVRAAVA